LPRPAAGRGQLPATQAAFKLIADRSIEILAD